MNGMDNALYFAIVAALIVGGVFAFRAVLKFLEWRDGDQDAFWNFLALSCGAASGILFFIGLAALTGGSSTYAAVEVGIYLGTILALAGLGLTFYFIFMKWWNSK